LAVVAGMKKTKGHAEPTKVERSKTKNKSSLAMSENIHYGQHM